MSTLLLLAHVADAAPFAALLPEGVEVRPFVQMGLSSAYHQLAARLRRGGRLLPGLLVHARASLPVEAYERIVFASWSAPYALAEELLIDDDDAAALSGWVALDSGYGVPTPGVVQLARRAREGQALYWAGHTDVPTAGYASSGAFLAEVVRQAGEPTGLFRVEHWAADPAARRAAHDSGAFWRAEHTAALHRGPAYGAEALDALGVVAPASAPPASESLGCRALRLSLAELDAGVREVPAGSNDGPRLRIYRAGAMRHGRPLVAGPGPWCAYAASWATFSSLLPGEASPHGWRASVAELVIDARASGTWHPAGDGYVPRPGDLAVFARAGADPTRGGEGHVGRVERVDGDTLVTIDGNHLDRWARVTRAITEALGFISYPQE